VAARFNLRREKNRAETVARCLSRADRRAAARVMKRWRTARCKLRRCADGSLDVAAFLKNVSG